MTRRKKAAAQDAATWGGPPAPKGVKEEEKKGKEVSLGQKVSRDLLLDLKAVALEESRRRGHRVTLKDLTKEAFEYIIKKYRGGTTA